MTARSASGDGANARDALDEITLLRGLPESHLQQVSEQLHGRSFPAGTTLMTVEQSGDAVYFIQSGTVKVHIEQEDGTDVILAILGHGETVGEMSVLDHKQRAASVLTLEESSLLWMDRAAFRSCLLTMPVLAYNLACLLSARLRHANDQIQSLAACGTETRIARQILAFAEKYGRPSDDGLLIPIRLTQTDIAALTGASREHTNKILVSYKERGYLSTDRRHYFTIHNSEALTRRSV
ncbi:MAG: Crp/Fnr family transcriptional regulator [Acidobacteriota bacterium]